MCIILALALAHWIWNKTVYKVKALTARFAVCKLYCIPIFYQQDSDVDVDVNTDLSVDFQI